MSNINPDPFTTRPEIEGTFGVVTSTHWIATAVGMAHAGEGRQCLRRRRRHRVYAAGGRAASERPRRRRADHRPRRQARPHRGDLRPGPRSTRRDHRALPQRGPGDGARHRPAGGLRSRHLRILDAAVARLRHACGCATCWNPPSPMPATAIRWWSALRDHQDRRAIVPEALDHLGRGLSAQR